MNDLFELMDHDLDKHRPLRFDGSDYDKKKDQVRLTGQIKRIFNLMQDGQWRTLEEIAKTTEDPAASVSAQLRNLRKERFGHYRVEKRARGDRKTGLFEYKLIVDNTVIQV